VSFRRSSRRDSRCSDKQHQTAKLAWSNDFAGVITLAKY